MFEIAAYFMDLNLGRIIFHNILTSIEKHILVYTNFAKLKQNNASLSMRHSQSQVCGYTPNISYALNSLHMQIYQFHC